MNFFRRTAASLQSSTDALLAERAADGDIDAFEALARRHSPAMRAQARRLTMSASDADDAVQDALLRAWSGIADLREPAAVRGWMMRITANSALALIRRRGPSTANEDELALHPDPGPGPEAASISGSALTHLGQALSKLPEPQRQCWVMREMGGLPYEEIAKLLDISETSVRGRITRARATLVKEMEAWR
ncbi:RNA polymerase sigma-70 factor (ECF subfamily) [Arthrobacter oryzae]|uniref:RNA polymerase sigma factor n=1 Tax=Arthrobacter TaxID=1663 RepID=UPI001F3E9472|nr:MULTISPECIES: RNA polymerase sigma factor [Arthrobacter]MDP9989372.1 RNA polymerase sigma-70 factor (ECF subfamily) [Arthrobacter oryzae]UKA71458.1 RNA polymerase sigma factor [Arthrobacter sp. FW306-06-A]